MWWVGFLRAREAAQCLTDLLRALTTCVSSSFHVFRGGDRGSQTWDRTAVGLQEAGVLGVGQERGGLRPAQLRSAGGEGAGMFVVWVWPALAAWGSRQQAVLSRASARWAWGLLGERHGQVAHGDDTPVNRGLEGLSFCFAYLVLIFITWKFSLSQRK